MEIKKRNILNVLVNANNQLMVGDTYVDNIKDLRKKAKDFITASGEYAGERGPELHAVNPEKNPDLVKHFGQDVMVTKQHVISLQSDYGTSYDKYIQVQNELVAAYNELRQKSLRTSSARTTAKKNWMKARLRQSRTIIQ